MFVARLSKAGVTCSADTIETRLFPPAFRRDTRLPNPARVCSDCYAVLAFRQPQSQPQPQSAAASPGSAAFKERMSETEREF